MARINLLVSSSTAQLVLTTDNLQPLLDHCSGYYSLSLPVQYLEHNKVSPASPHSAGHFLLAPQDLAVWFLLHCLALSPAITHCSGYFPGSRPWLRAGMALKCGISP